MRVTAAESPPTMANAIGAVKIRNADRSSNRKIADQAAKTRAPLARVLAEDPVNVATAMHQPIHRNPKARATADTAGIKAFRGSFTTVCPDKE